ncbi:MAG: NADH-quinone oxidoreductase subunit NuoF [Planctomycetota bacterium]
MAEIYLTRRVNLEQSHTLAIYRSDGGYETARKVLTEMMPDQVTDEVKASGLRGRGGAGFPAGVKWGFMPKEPKVPSYLVVNADESEPGTFKDRLILEKNPHMLLEGMLISSYAIRANTAWVYVRGEYFKPYHRLQAAIEEARKAGLLGERIMGTKYHLNVILHRGGGAYICGEETALMESLEGKRGHPRPKPPFPAQYGVFGNPSNVNNVETLANVPAIIAKGAAWFRSLGTEKSTGNQIFGVSGHVENPGLFELPMGTPARELIEKHAGGVWKGRHLKAFIPGGSSTGFVPAAKVDVAMDHESLAQAGAMLGTGGMIVIDDHTCIVKALWNLARFYDDETCGQCAPCRESCNWTMRILERIEAGKGIPQDIEMLRRIGRHSRGRTICVYPDALGIPVKTALDHFEGEFVEHIRRKGCPLKPAASESVLCQG